VLRPSPSCFTSARMSGIPPWSPMGLPGKLHSFNRWLHAFLAMLAVILLLFYGTTGFMLNHDTWFKKSASLPSSEGRLEARTLLAEPDKNQDAIAAELKTRFGIKEKFRYSWWNEGHFILHFANLGKNTDVEINPQ